MLPTLLALALGASPDASEIFARSATRVAQVRVLATDTGSRAALGSGFFVTSDGLLATNFHVVSSFAWRPSAYTLEVAWKDQTRQASLVDVDPVHDVALLRISLPADQPMEPLALETTEPQRGATLYSLGNPHDVGLSIVEGTFNGIVDGQLVDQYHFSGNLNSGVSGGPALDAAGRVVGVNVASKGNALSFLVPARHVQTLLSRVEAGTPPTGDYVARVNELTLAQQEEVSRALLADPAPTTTLGAWTLPGRLVPRLKQWGGPLNDDEEDDLFRVTGYDVHSGSSTYLRSGEQTGGIVVKHRLYEPAGASAVPLFRRASWLLQERESNSYGDDEDFHTRWRCRERVIEQHGARLKTQTCLRAYRKLQGLYDLSLRTMTFDSPRTTVVSSLELFGFSRDNAAAVASHWLEGFAWAP